MRLDWEAESRRASALVASYSTSALRTSRAGESDGDPVAEPLLPSHDNARSNEDNE